MNKPWRYERKLWMHWRSPADLSKVAFAGWKFGIDAYCSHRRNSGRKP